MMINPRGVSISPIRYLSTKIDKLREMPGMARESINPKKTELFSRKLKRAKAFPSIIPAIRTMLVLVTEITREFRR
jgi:hypothetical protein